MDTNYLKELIGTKSISSQEKAVLKKIFSYGKSFGINVFYQEENVTFHIKGENSHKALIFDGHVDTVSEGEKTKWAHPPFGKTIDIEGDKIFGLGASDMKGGVFALLEVAKFFSNHIPSCDLWFSFVVKEEIDGSGSKSFTQWFKQNKLKEYDQVSAIIAEPTSLNEVELGHRGNYFVEITTTGDSGHGAYPEKIQTHAVIEMYKVYDILKKLEKVWIKKYSHTFLGKPSIGYFTSIKAGEVSSPNKFPTSCKATFDIRTTPELHHQVLKELTGVLKNIKCSIKPLFDPAPYSFTSNTSEIVSVIKKILPEIKLSAAKGASDQCFFTEVGIATIVIGPGEKSCIHKPDEYCYLSKIENAINIYKRIIQLF